MDTIRVLYSRHKVLFVVGCIAIFAAFIWLFTLRSDTVQDSAAQEQVPTVTVKAVGELSTGAASIETVGEVSSKSQAELRAERTGTLTRVYVAVGQVVSAGTLLAELENAAERAAVTQAQGALASAQAQLARLRAGNRPEDVAIAATQQAGATQSLEEAQAAATTAFTQAFSAAQDAVYAKTDVFYNSPRTVRPQFRPASADYDESIALENLRVQIGETLTQWEQESRLPGTNIDTKLNNALSRLRTIDRYLDQVSFYVSTQKLRTDLTTADIDAQEAVVSAAQAEIDAALASVQGARQGLVTARTNQSVYSSQLAQTQAGNRPEDIRAGEASVLSAQGAVAAAIAQLEKTRARSPIAGTVSVLPIKSGQFIAPPELMAIVSNPGAQEVVAYIAPEDIENVTVGAPVSIGDSLTGTVTTVAPGIDPATNRIRITVGLPSGSNLINGDTVRIAISRAEAPHMQTELSVPITAVKITAQQTLVFSVDENNTLVPHEVKIGTIVSGKILITEGLTSDMRIITDARGRKAGEVVRIQES